MSTTSDFTEIKQHGNWHKRDQIGCSRLVDGMRLAIRWPDGTETNETIKIARTNVLAASAGNIGTFMHVDYAYVPTLVMGVKAWVHLRGLQAKILD